MKKQLIKDLARLLGVILAGSVLAFIGIAFLWLCGSLGCRM